jgi:hypothetical protein
VLGVLAVCVPAAVAVAAAVPGQAAPIVGAGALLFSAGLNHRADGLVGAINPAS